MGFKLSVIIFLFVVFIKGCAIFNYDRSDELIAKEIIGKCYKTVQTTSVIKYGVIGSSYNLHPADRKLDRGYVKKVKQFEPGLRFEVTKVVDFAFGETGRCWQVQVKLLNGYFKDEMVKIPSCRFFSSHHPMWIIESTSLKIEPEYAIPCVASK